MLEWNNVEERQAVKSALFKMYLNGDLTFNPLDNLISELATTILHISSILFEHDTVPSSIKSQLIDHTNAYITELRYLKMYTDINSGIAPVSQECRAIGLGAIASLVAATESFFESLNEEPPKELHHINDISKGNSKIVLQKLNMAKSNLAKINELINNHDIESSLNIFIKLDLDFEEEYLKELQIINILGSYSKINILLESILGNNPEATFFCKGVLNEF